MTAKFIQSKGAQLSVCGLYRYKLTRKVGDGGYKALWIGVNPSTADASIDDASIRKLYGFGRRLNVDEWMVGNLFAYRATDVRELAKVDDPVGPNNDGYLAEMIEAADIIFAGWGQIGKVPPRLRHRWRDLLLITQVFDRVMWCWGTCSDGHPRHPLMLPYDTPMVPWLPPEGVTQ
jgi:hypothetical protein